MQLIYFCPDFMLMDCFIFEYPNVEVRGWLMILMIRVIEHYIHMKQKRRQQQQQQQKRTM